MKTRQDYMAGKCTHREYYAQFVTPDIKQIVKQRIGLDAIQRSADPNLNDIPLGKWDVATGFPNRVLGHRQLKEAGDNCTLSSGVCILKEAARQLAEEAAK